MDVFGNYVVQKLFEVCDQAQKVDIAGKMEGNVFKLSMEMYGCRVGFSFPLSMFFPVSPQSLLPSPLVHILLHTRYPSNPRRELGPCSRPTSVLAASEKRFGEPPCQVSLPLFLLFPLVTLVSLFLSLALPFTPKGKMS